MGHECLIIIKKIICRLGTSECSYDVFDRRVYHTHTCADARTNANNWMYVYEDMPTLKKKL